MPKLKRTLGLSECVFFGVGSILGAGVYTLIGKVAGLSGNMIWVSFSIASLTALLTAFSYAELSSMYPKAGGEYVYAKKAFGAKLGFILGVVISLNGIVSGATVAIGFAGYFVELIEIDQLFAALGIILLIFIVNAMGIRQSSTVNIVFTLLEVGGLFFVIYSAIPSLGNNDLLKMASSGMQGIFSAAALAFFAYMGFEEIVKLAEETENPKKIIPKALFLASTIVILIYTIISICAVSVISFEELGKSESPLADIVEKSFGNTGVLIISAIALFATSNTILSNMLGSSRVILNMSQQTDSFKFFSKVSEKRKSPIAALLLILILMIGFSLIEKIETVAKITTIFIFITFIIVNLSVIFLRIKDRDAERVYKIPFNFKNISILSVLGILLTLFLMAFSIHSLLTNPFF